LAQQQLDSNVAQKLASSLKSIKGLSFDADVVRATAEDLVRWCRGCTLDGVSWSPEDQAQYVVTEAREKWFGVERHLRYAADLP
jgi:hypothetical protein